MGTTINIRTEVSRAVADLQKMGSQLTQRQINTGISRGINKTLLLGRTEARAAVKSVYTVAQRGLDGRVDIDKSTVYNRAGKSLRNTFLTGAVTASSVPLPMELFKVRFNPTATSVSTFTKRGKKVTKGASRKINYKGGVTIEAEKGKTKIIPYAFMLPTKSAKVFGRGMYKTGSTWGFVRRKFGSEQKGQNRHSSLSNRKSSANVVPLLSVTIHAAAINKKSQALIEAKIRNNYLRNIEHELNVLNNGIVK